MSQIKNIIFDLGGVLLNIDYNKTSIAFKKLGVVNFDELYAQSKANELFENLETGLISNEDFYIAIEK
jgi:putative hydrolase of the HAD superfamily